MKSKKHGGTSPSKYLLPTRFDNRMFFGIDFDAIIASNLLVNDKTDIDFSTVYDAQKDNEKSWKKRSKEQRKHFNANINCILMNLLLNGVLNFDGTCDDLYAYKAKKREMWSYIYYLWSINCSKLKIFEEMGFQDPDDFDHYKPDAARFVKVVRDTLTASNEILDPQYFHIRDLAAFVNHVYKLHGQEILNPKLMILFNQVEKMIISKEDGLSSAVKTIQQQIENTENELTTKANISIVEGDEKEFTSAKVHTLTNVKVTTIPPPEDSSNKPFEVVVNARVDPSKSGGRNENKSI